MFKVMHKYGFFVVLACLLVSRGRGAERQLPIAPLAGQQRVADIDYRLQTQNTALCAEPAFMPSFQIADERDARVFLTLTDGPAAAAGLHAGDVLTRINDHVAAGQNISDLIDAALDKSGDVALTLADGRALHFTERQGCGFHIGVEQGQSLNSYADGENGNLTTALVKFTVNDDELAFIVAHELAHNYLRHKERLDKSHVTHGLLAMFGKSAGLIKQTEEEADVMGLYLMARAGYDITKIPSFWARFGARTGTDILSDGTHPRTKARIALAEATIAEINTKRGTGARLAPNFYPQR